MLIKTGAGLVDYAKYHLGAGYWWGCYGQRATKKLLEFKTNQYPDVYKTELYSDALNQIGKRVFDCCGLIKGYLWSDTPNSEPSYDASTDVNVNGLFIRCRETGVLSSIPEILGVCVFTPSLDHVGVYIGNGYVIEARGHKYGVVKTKLQERGWRLWGKPSMIDYSDSFNTKWNEPYQKLSSTDKVMIDRLPMIKEGSKGVFVKMLQLLLSYHKYDVDDTGLYDFNTYMAVKDWQKKLGLEVDGICGKNTWTSFLI